MQRWQKSDASKPSVEPAVGGKAAVVGIVTDDEKDGDKEAVDDGKGELRPKRPHERNRYEAGAIEDESGNEDQKCLDR